MHEIVCQEDNKLEISLYGEVKDNEFQEIAHQIESMCAQNAKVDILLDAGGLESWDVTQALEQYDFYKKYKDNLNRVGLITDSKLKSTLIEQFGKFADVEFKAFTNEETDDARKWVFPSPLP